MARFLAFAVTALSILFCASANAQSETPGPTEPVHLYRAKVVGIVDGDTFVADIDLGFHIRINKRLRLLGIHAPEPEGERSTAGKTAAECLRKLIDAKNIIIRTAKGSDGADRDVDGRWLVVAYLDGLEVNDSMLSKAQLCRVVDPRRAATAMPERVLATWSDR
jgi:micrococcal nuclease